MTCDPRVADELYARFTYDVPGAKFDRRFRRGYWDGQVHNFATGTGLIYVGLWQRIADFCAERGYEFLYDPGRRPGADDHWPGFIDTLDTGREARPYQRKMFERGAVMDRALFVCPTASGKSLAIYYLAKFYGLRTLLIVPRKGLVRQMRTDFETYGWDPNDIHEIMEGASKVSHAGLTVATYQSIHKLPLQWFSRFDVVIGDEAHLFQAKTLVTMMKKLRTCKYRFGFTGTLDGWECHSSTLEGLFGPIYQAAQSSDLIEAGYLARLQIRCVVLKHPEIASILYSDSYDDEMKYLCGCEARNRFLCNLVTSLRGNTLLLFQYVEKHGAILERMIREAVSDRPVYYVHGGVETEVREGIRAGIENDDDAIYVASYGTLSTGVNIPKLHNLIFASPSKSRIRNLQSIGRILRLHETKDVATLYDVADDMTAGGDRNYTLNHFIERVKIYNTERFPYTVHGASLKS